VNNLKAYHSIWLHLIIGTANRLPLILPDNENLIFKIISDCLVNQKCKIEAINGDLNHIHVLFNIQPFQSISTIVGEIIEESLTTINQDIFPAHSFGWDQNYAIFSVSQSQVSKVKEYIENQKSIHQHKSFQKEWHEFINVHGIQND
jgi:REP element-mobilizing transposase RayT